MLLLCFFSCTPTVDTSTDSAVEVEPTPMAWMRGNPPLTASEGSIRAIVHLHSHHSHDACDGEPQPEGIPDEDCLADLRNALCVVRIDAAFLSDHPAHSTEVDDFSELFLIRGHDTPIYENGVLIANQISCDNGHQVYIFPGIESSEMMPLALNHHIEGSYDGSPEAMAQIEEQHAIKWIAHIEERPLEELISKNLEGIEIYQLHANLDPQIRQEYLGLGSFDYLQEVQPFFFPMEDEENSPHPDLAVLGFLLPNEPSLDKMEHLGMLQPIGVSGGTDAHQNVFSNDAPDGERIDSYRRMMRWFHTRINVGQNSSPREIIEALRNRKSWIAFEVFGTPEGFSMVVQNGESTHPMGEEITLEAGQELQVSLPSLSALSPQEPNTRPNIEGRIFYFDGTTRTQVHTWTSGSATYPISQAGVYRVEVWIQPLHLTPYLGERPEYAQKWMPWIYSGGVFVR